MTTKLEDGRQVIDLPNKRRVTLTKSDGSSLYISRDIAAVLDRFQSFKPQKMIYVVEHGQSNHFLNLFEICQKLVPVEFEHVMFGRIQGMSTRKGTAIFLEDILDEAKFRMLEKIKNSPNTKISWENYQETAEILGISAVIINDLKFKKTRNYEFSWAEALQDKGNSGLFLQYTHCRLCNLIENNSEIPKITNFEDLDFEKLQEPEVIQLILSCAQFEEKFMMTCTRLEPSILVKYLFKLCNDSNRANQVLRIKGIQDEEKAALRLALFKVTKNILHFGMSVLGLKPLEKM